MGGFRIDVKNIVEEWSCKEAQGSARSAGAGPGCPLKVDLEPRTQDLGPRTQDLGPRTEGTEGPRTEGYEEQFMTLAITPLRALRHGGG